jgi:molybdate transport system substrate-binding protein
MLHVTRRLVLLGLMSLTCLPAAAQEHPLVIFAAASLKGPLDKAAEAWKAEGGKAVTISYAASSALMKQIEQGAPADLFASADRDWMEYGVKRELIRKDSVVELLGNKLVLVAPASFAGTVDLKQGFDLAGLIGHSRLATGEVSSVPAGKYAKAALEHLDLWKSVEPKLAMADNVRSALAFVARGEAAFGIVYATDARAEPKVKVLATFPADSHPPIVYPFALTAASTNPDATAFLAFLKGEKAASIFEAAGFYRLD